MTSANDPHDLLARSTRLGIRLWVDGDRLCYEAAQGALTPDLRSELRRHKSDLIALLRSREPAEFVGESQNRDPRLYPASFLQERFWHYQNANPADCLFNIPFAFRLIGKLDIEALKRSFDAILLRHELLRTTLKSVDGTLMQVVHDPRPFDLRLIDLQHLAEPVQSRELRRVRLEILERPFDPSSAYPMRVVLVRLDRETHVLCFCLYRSLVEECSLFNFFTEIESHYAGSVTGNPEKRPALPMQYADFARLERQTLTPERFESTLTYWRRWFGEEIPPALKLPAEVPGTEHNFRAARFAFELSPAITHALKSLSRESGTTPFMAVLTVYAMLLGSISGSRDFVIGVPYVNRNHWMFESLIGAIGDVMAIRIKLGDDPDFFSLLGRVRDWVLDALHHQRVPFEQIASRLSLGLSNNAPLFRMLLSFLGQGPIEQLRLLGLQVTSMENEDFVMRPELTLVVWESTSTSGNSLEGYWQYRKDLFEDDAIRRLSADFHALCERIANHPERALHRLQHQS